jgi:Spy/CpxP family protein refolding chaperone
MKHGALAALMVVVLAAGFALAQPGPGMTAPAPNAKAQAPMACGMQGMQGMMQGPAMPGMMGMMAGMPDVTPEQMEKCDALRVAHMKTVMPIRTDIQVAEIELDALWRADKLDAKKIVAKVNEVGGLRQKLELAMVNQRIDMYNLMTPDQQKAMRKMHMGRGMMGKGMGRGMRGMMCGQMGGEGCGMQGGNQCGGPQGPMGQGGQPGCKMR